MAFDSALTALWNGPALAVSGEPFEHVCVDDFLPRPLFEALAATFPECPSATGPTGFTIHPGDPQFDQLMAGNADWAAFARACDGPAFTAFVLRQFADCFARQAVVDLGGARHVQYQESRADKERARMERIERAPDELWVRFDLMQGRTGYERRVHVDHRRRAATMLIYFSDADDSVAEGGDLQLHATRTSGPAKTVTPRANRMVMFPCNNASWHSVSRIVRQAHPRNFLQVTLSSCSDLWPPLPRSPMARLRDAARSVKATLQSA
jgi:hypothetical protein